MKYRVITFSSHYGSTYETVYHDLEKAEEHFNDCLSTDHIVSVLLLQEDIPKDTWNPIASMSRVRGVITVVR